MPANSNTFTNVQNTYKAEWQIVDDLISITFEGQVPTTGWVGFGINGQDQMPGGDVVVGIVFSNIKFRFCDLEWNTIENEQTNERNKQ